MAQTIRPGLSHLSWPGAADLPPDVADTLLGPGAPFELGVEPVLGHTHTVFLRRPRTLRQALESQRGNAPDLPFLVSPERVWSYREAIEDIDALAVLLRERYGVGVGDRVAIVAANDAEYAILMWAVVTLGGIITSLNGWWTTPELDYGLELTAPTLVAGDVRRLARLRDSSRAAALPVRRFDELRAQAREFAGRAPAPAASTEDTPAVIVFTSGTTGRPKGATLSHRNIIGGTMLGRLRAAFALALRPASAERPSSPPPQAGMLVSSPMFHVSGLAGIFITGTSTSSKLVFAPAGPWDPAVTMRLTAEHRITAWSGVPTQFWRILRHPDIETYDLRSLVSIGSGGAVFAPELVRALHDRFPGIALGNGYGMSETAGLGTQISGGPFLETPDSVGPPIPTTEIEIRGEDGEVVPAGEVGEIYLRSPSVFLGYWENPAATEAVLDGNRWYRTGDYGSVAGGRLYLHSRRRDLILRGGENIYPIEIENRLIEHPDIADATVIGVDHAELGQEVKAFVVPRDGAVLTVEQVRTWCASTLASFKIPALVEFRASLPYTRTGKVLKNELEREERDRSSS